MPLGRGIAQVLEAIPDRIEVSGHPPTWRVTGASYDAVRRYVEEAYGDATVIGRSDRSRWWPRVTLTVTTDPVLAAAAPGPEAFVDPEPEPDPAPAPARETAAAEQPEQPEPAAPTVPEGWRPSALEEIFAAQEAARMERLVPGQRRARR